MKSNYNTENIEAEPHRNRDERRALYKRLQPKIKRIVELEKQIRIFKENDNENKE